MTVIITGGAGFIGSTLVGALVAEGARVVTLDALDYAGREENLAAVAGKSNHRFVHADIRDRQAVATVLAEEQPACIFHLAAQTHVDRSIDGPARFFETNTLGSYELVETVTAWWRELPAGTREAFRFVHASTDEVFGSAGPDEVFTEASRYDPSSPYAASKAAADHLVRIWSKTFGLPVLVAHGSNTYGPRQFPEKLIPLMVLNALEGRELPVYGTGEQVRDWLHVDDHAAGLRAVARAGLVGESYILSARNRRRNIDIVREVCAVLDRLRPAQAPHDRLIRHVADRPAHDERYAPEPAKAEAELAWRAHAEYPAALARTVEWYLANRNWCAGAGHVYDRQRLGLGAGVR